MLLVLLMGYLFSDAQQAIKVFGQETYTDQIYQELRGAVGKNKSIPIQFEKQILLALCYFPELSSVSIEFRISKTRTPLSSRPAWSSVFISSAKRKYIITISDSTIPSLSPILFKYLSFNAQVGVIGHELSHIADFNAKKSSGLIWIGLGNLSRRFLDRFEYRTDSSCIAHGLGNQLLAWSIFVRQALGHANWTGADNIHKMMKRERYMNPETITQQMQVNPIYEQSLL